MAFEFHLPSLEEMRATRDGLEMLRMVDNDNFRSALISGCPGSGKTTVAIYRLARLTNQNENVRLLTYQNLLVRAIQNLAGTSGVSPQQVSTFHQWYCRLVNGGFQTDNPPSSAEILDNLNNSSLDNQQNTEIIIDEGQDLPECVYRAVPQFFDRCFVGADNGQQVHPNHGAKMEEIEEILQTDFDPYLRLPLGRNFRNTYEVYRFARQFIPRTNLVAWDNTILKRLHHEDRHGPKPTVITYNNIQSRNNHLRTTLQNAEGNVGILCPLGSIPPAARNHSGESVEEMYGMIQGMDLPVSQYYNKVNLPNDLERYIVTTFISAKGLEFDVVVVPRINFFIPIPQEWYVACTRARGQLFIYQDLEDPQCNPISNCTADTYISESADSHDVEQDDFSF